MEEAVVTVVVAVVIMEMAMTHTKLRSVVVMEMAVIKAVDGKDMEVAVVMEMVVVDMKVVMEMEDIVPSIIALTSTLGDPDSGASPSILANFYFIVPSGFVTYDAVSSHLGFFPLLCFEFLDFFFRDGQLALRAFLGK
ncbi:hypothetical protein Bca4012_028075 [Brassica carinata]